MGWIMDMRVRLVSPSPSPAVALAGRGDELWRDMISRVVSFWNRVSFEE